MVEIYMADIHVCICIYIYIYIYEQLYIYMKNKSNEIKAAVLEAHVE